MQTDGNLRHVAICIEDGIPSHAHFCTNDVLLKMQSGQSECRTGATGIQILTGNGKLKAVFESHGRADNIQTVVLGSGGTGKSREAGFTSCGVGANHGPRGQAAARRTFNAADPTGQ